MSVRQRNLKTWICHSHDSFGVQSAIMRKIENERDNVYLSLLYIQVTSWSIIWISPVHSRYTVWSRDTIIFSHRWSHYFHRLPQCRRPSARTNYNINDCRCKSTSTKGSDIRRASKSFNSVKYKVRKYKTNMQVYLDN